MTDQAGAWAPEVAEAGLEDWIDRVIALTGLGTGLGVVLLAYDQSGSLDRVSLLAIAGVLLFASVLLPVFAWSRRGIRLPATLYALSVVVGLYAWPFMWTGPYVANGDQPPWLWPCIGVSTVVVSVAWGNLSGVGHNIVCSVAFLIARLSPLGGTISAATAVQDTLIVAVQPLMVMAMFATVRRQAGTLDAWVTAAHRSQAGATLQAALVDERTRMDALVHDEVMTALVAGARNPGDHDPSVSALARRAIASLQAQSTPDPDDTPVLPANVARLLHDVATSVTPGVRYVSDVDPLAPLLPRAVVEAMVPALREAVLNADKHAAADEVVVTVVCRADRNGVRLSVEIVDDGVGFDPGAIPEGPLGVRLSLLRRLRAVSGQAAVQSTPGQGTRVTLTWSGAGASAPLALPDASPLLDHPALGKLDLAPVALMAGGGATLFTVVAAIQSLESPRPELVWFSFLLLGIAVPLCLHRFGRRIPRSAAVVVVLLGIAVTVLNLAALPDGAWALHSTDFVGTICVLVVLLLAGWRRLSAWILALAAGALVMGATWWLHGSLLVELRAVLNPVGWLVAAEMLLYWMRGVRRQLDVAQRAADEASSESAASFARLVVREVWVTEVRETAGDLLALLADPNARITRVDREACLAAEGKLRDRIRTANFSAPSLSVAIMRARMRGVQVTLVDNRGGRLEENVRRVASRHLEHLVERATQGRIVARTAPEGYDEAVTIVEMGEHGSSLPRISDDGTMVVTQT